MNMDLDEADVLFLFECVLRSGAVGSGRDGILRRLYEFDPNGLQQFCFCPDGDMIHEPGCPLKGIA